MDDQQLLTPPVPPKLRHLMDEPALAQAWEHQVSARQAEAAKIRVLVDHVAACRDEHCDEYDFIQDAAERAAVHQAALLLGFSDQSTAITLNVAEYAREHLPWSWEAFCRGLIDTLRLRKISTAAQNLTGLNLAGADVQRLDPAAALEAIDRSLGDFQNWLHRFIAHLDYDAYTAQCARNRAQRYVGFSHGTDGMSFIEARIPTVEAAAIQKRLSLTARRHHRAAQDTAAQDTAAQDTGDTGAPQHQAGADNGSATGHQAQMPTLAQREADLFSAWLRTGDTPEDGARPVEAKIMIMIPETTLTGGSNQPAMAADRSWMLAADQARTLAGHPDAEHHWYHGRTRPNRAGADVDVLSVTYAGRYPPQRLRDALLFRDGVCTTQGCTIAAERSDIDHHTPFDAGGPTNAANLSSLCRRHHRLKSHGFLHPPAPPEATGRDSPRDRPRRRPQCPPADLIHTAAHPITYAV
ncbi:HNH endonuclease [Garicola koreensis]|uniref:HNH nuclease domain-containing protein n=1 Tax=Garicola koreensis TaxID=1262554 RepID=A0A7W5TUC5_9MICC|nr:HNH endonuclease signature motif containing protein [Garicola koreensis]MBB3666999.1 hypothetical protein [Garicola koreensis]